ncbi:hypothetical protein F4212_14775 [Candidatus Poribacteria bacterium]|nr:hypothetical protein [Candidatus Poribacteria bacterium]
MNRYPGMKMAAALALALAFILAGCAGASAELLDDDTNIDDGMDGLSDALDDMQDRISLWSECVPVFLHVGLQNDKAEADLTTTRIKTAVESRLRGARIYGGDSGKATMHDPVLAVQVQIVGYAFWVGFSFVQNVITLRAIENILDDPERELPIEATIGLASAFASSRAPTWEKATLGTHGGDAGYILQSVAEKMDQFINEYLRVNADACN